VTEKDFWKALGDVFENCEIPCSLCPAFIYNGCCTRECGVSCERALKATYLEVMEKKK
jgi:hypothetical protein